MSRKRRHKPEPDRLHKIPVPNGGNGSLALAVADMQNPTPTQDVQVLDQFQNALARIGYGTPNLNETADYVNTRLTRNFMLLTTLYRSHWVIRKIIDVPAEDMCKNWYQFSSDITPEMIDRYQRKEKVTKTKAGIVKGLKWGRLYGGGGAVIMIKGHEDYLNQPLDYETILPGSYSGLMVFDRWSGIQPNADLIDDLDSPDFGLPRSYTITLGTGAGSFDVHSSRVLRFPGRYLPFWEEQAEINWGCSEVELVFDELKKRDNASWNIASLLFMANIRVMKMGDLRQMLSSGNQMVQSKLYSTLSAQNHLMSNQGMLVLDKDDSYEQHETTGFKGIADVYETFMLDLAGAAEMPVTKLFGRAPAGMNATGESDLQQYYDSIEQKQESTLRPVLDKLMPVIAMSEWGYIPEDLDFTFNPPATVPSDKLAELAAKRTSSVVEVFNTGLISQQIALKELRQMSDETGMWTNITDEEISAADTEVHPPGEMLPPGMEGGAPEGAEGPGTAGPPEPGGTPPPLQGGSDSPGSGSEAPSHDKMLGWIGRMREFIQGYLGKAETPGAVETEDDDRLSDDLRMNTMFARIESLLWKANKGKDADTTHFETTDSDAEWTYAGGYTVTIENPIGSIRSGTDKNGRPWSIEMKNPYGYVNGVRGKDKDQLDCFLGDNPYSDDVFIIDQIDPDTRNFDEHKIIFGANSEQEAMNIYYANYQPGWRGLGDISHMTGAEFKDWVEDGGPKAPYAYEKKGGPR